MYSYYHIKFKVIFIVDDIFFSASEVASDGNLVHVFRKHTATPIPFFKPRLFLSV